MRKVVAALLLFVVAAAVGYCLGLTTASKPAVTVTQPVTTTSTITKTVTVEKAITITAHPGFPVTVVDFAGRKVTFERPPERVIALTTYWAETLCVLGLTDRIVGIGKYVPYSPYVPESVKSKPVVGSIFKGLNWETVLALNPDLIVTDWYGGKYGEGRIIERAERYGIKVIALSAKSVEDNIKAIELLGKVFGVSDRAEELISWMKSKLSEVKSIASKIKNRKNVLMVSAPRSPTKPVVVYARGSAWASVVELVGAHNVAFDYEFGTPWPKLDLEKLIAYFGNKTDVLIVLAWSNKTLQKALNLIRSDPRWQAIKAVREGKVYGVVVGYRGFLDWGPRIIVGVYQLGNIIYPEAYPDWRAVAKELFAKFYAYLHGGP